MVVCYSQRDCSKQHNDAQLLFVACVSRIDDAVRINKRKVRMRTKETHIEASKNTA
jgi:hypothetical protein